MSVRLLGLAVMVMMLVRTNDTKERHHRQELVTNHRARELRVTNHGEISRDSVPNDT